MDIVVRATVIFFLLFIALRAMGPRELGEMSPFEFIVTIMIGDLVQQSITQNDYSITAAALAVGTILFWTLVMSWTACLSPPLQRVLEGEPRVVLKDGEFLKKNARPLRVSRSDVESAMRENSIASIKDVALGVMEPDGKLTFLKKGKQA